MGGWLVFLCESGEASGLCEESTLALDGTKCGWMHQISQSCLKSCLHPYSTSLQGTEVTRMEGMRCIKRQDPESLGVIAE